MARNRDGAPDEVDYRHRTAVNLVAAIALLVIAIAVVWTINLLDERRKTERCLASGRHNCTQIETAPRGPISLQH